MLTTLMNNPNWLTASATILSAIVAATITGVFGFIQYRIAKSQKIIAQAQKDIAYDKLKYDIFTKRYSIYKACFLTCNNMALPNAKATIEEIESWSLIIEEAVFFFPDDVVKVTKKITALSGELVLGMRNESQPNLRFFDITLRKDYAHIPKEALEIGVILHILFERELSFQQFVKK